MSDYSETHEPDQWAENAARGVFTGTTAMPREKCRMAKASLRSGGFTHNCPGDGCAICARQRTREVAPAPTVNLTRIPAIVSPAKTIAADFVPVAAAPIPLGEQISPHVILAPSPHAEQKLLSIGKACALVSVSRRTLYNWMGSGRLEYVRTAGGAIRIHSDSLFRVRARREESRELRAKQPRLGDAEPSIGRGLREKDIEYEARRTIRHLISRHGVAFVMEICAEIMEPTH